MKFPIPITLNSPRRELCQIYNQTLIDEMHARGFTGKRSPTRAHSAIAFGRTVKGFKFSYRASLFARDPNPLSSTCLMIFSHSKSQQEVLAVFEALKERQAEIEADFGRSLEWGRDYSPGQKRQTICIYRDRSVEPSMRELEQIGDWHIENLLRFKEVFTPKIKLVLSIMV